MLIARSDEKVLGYLGRALSLELSAAQQYATQARLVASWGFKDAAASLRTEAEEEWGHADRIIGRMLATGVAPGSSQLRPVRLADNLIGLLSLNKALEADIISLYLSATRYCAETADQDGRIFFEELLNEEQQHLSDLQDWIDRLQQGTIDTEQ